VGFSSSHCLLQLEDFLIAFPFKAHERMFKQDFHSFGDIILLEEICRIDTVLNEITQIKNRISSLRVEDTVAWCAELL